MPRLIANEFAGVAAMLRGVNKQIIEINGTDNAFFEKAVLYVRPECCDISDTKLHTGALEFLDGLSVEKNKLPVGSCKKVKQSGKNTFKKTIVAAVATAFALLATVLGVVLIAING